VTHEKPSQDQLRVTTQVAADRATPTPTVSEGGSAARRLEFPSGNKSERPLGEKATPNSMVIIPTPAAAGSQEELIQCVLLLAKQVAVYNPTVPQEEPPEVLTNAIFLVNGNDDPSSRTQRRQLTQYLDAPTVTAKLRLSLEQWDTSSTSRSDRANQAANIRRRQIWATVGFSRKNVNQYNQPQGERKELTYPDESDDEDSEADEMEERTQHAPGNLRKLTGTVSAIQSATGATEKYLHNMELEHKAGAVMRAELQDLKLEMARNRAADRDLFKREQAQLQLEQECKTTGHDAKSWWRWYNSTQWRRMRHNELSVYSKLLGNMQYRQDWPGPV
jgi:hypothetical protein